MKKTKDQRRVTEVRVTLVPSALFDQLLARIDEPDPAPGLAAAVQRSRQRPRIRI